MVNFDFSAMIGGLNISSGLLAIYGGGALLLAVGFAHWLTDTIARWFDSHDDTDNEDDDAPDGFGWDNGGALECQSCGWYSDDEDAFHHAFNTGYCPKCGE